MDKLNSIELLFAPRLVEQQQHTDTSAAAVAERQAHGCQCGGANWMRSHLYIHGAKLANWQFGHCLCLTSVILVRSSTIVVLGKSNANCDFHCLPRSPLIEANSIYKYWLWQAHQCWVLFVALACLVIDWASLGSLLLFLFINSHTHSAPLLQNGTIVLFKID